MRSTAKKCASGGRYFSLPSIFDLCIAGFLGITYIKDSYHQQIFFIFYIIFLVCISIGLKPLREYKSIPLMLLSLWAFAGVFIHSLLIVPDSITSRYLNMYLMSEGFIYILFGSLFVMTIIKYSKSTWFYIIPISIAMIPLLKEFRAANSMTFVGSIIASVFIYLLLKKRFILSGLACIVGSLFAFLNWKWILMKFSCRPLVWKQLLIEITKHPFVGSGFDKGLKHPEGMIWIEQGMYGWIFRHNDYLSIGAYLGVLATILIVWFVIDALWKIKNRAVLIPFLAISIMCFFQMTMFHIPRAGVYILIGALCIKQVTKEAL